MEKKTKALLIGGLGAALLLGAGGTFAIWTDSAALTRSNSLKTGSLSLKGDGTIALADTWYWYKWSNATGDIDGTTPFTAEDSLVPGDAVIYQWNTDSKAVISEAVNFKGTTLKAKLYLEVGADAPLLESDELVVTIDEGEGARPVKGGDKILIHVYDGTESDFVLPEIIVGIPVDDQRKPVLQGDAITTDLSGLRLVLEQDVTLGDDIYNPNNVTRDTLYPGESIKD